MKRTTYILIGLLIAGLVVIVATIVAVSLSGKDNRIDSLMLDGEQVEMKLDGVHVVKMFVTQGEVMKPRHITMSGNLTVTNPLKAGKELFSYPKNQHLKVNQKNDTLFVELDFNEYSIPDRFKYKDWIPVIGLDLHLAVDTTFTSIVSKVEEVKLNLKGMRADSLCVRADRQSVLLDSCQFRSFDVKGNRLNFKAKNSKMDNFYLNLDNVRKWTFDNTEVGTQYLSGHGRQSNDLQKGECRRVVWTPLDKDARLQLNIREKAEINIMPE